MKILLNSVIKKLFGKKMPKISGENYVPYVEEDTMCDNCEYLSKCMKECYYIDCTTLQDARKHIIVGNSYCCKKN